MIERDPFDPLRSGVELLRLLDGATSATFIAPFITVAGFVPLLDALGAKSSIAVYTRWIPAEVAAGVSDPAIYDLVAGRGGAVFLEPRLHAKAYITNREALVGSANLTARALGFVDQSNLEILQPVQLPSPAVDALLDVLHRTAAPADRRAFEAVTAAAAMIPPSLRDESRPSRPWLPRHTVPHHICSTYLGYGAPVAKDILAADLDAIGAPPGLDHDLFKAHVAALLLQGVAGRVVHECRGQSAYVAVSRLVRLALEAGVDLPTGHEEQNAFWVTLVEWFHHFLGVEKTAGGRGFA